MSSLFSAKQQVILQSMYRYGHPLTIYEIVKKTGVSYITVKKALVLFSEKGIVLSTKKNNKTYWAINPEIEPCLPLKITKMITKFKSTKNN